MTTAAPTTTTTTTTTNYYCYYDCYDDYYYNYKDCPFAAAATTTTLLHYYCFLLWLLPILASSKGIPLQAATVAAALQTPRLVPALIQKFNALGTHAGAKGVHKLWNAYTHVVSMK